MANHRITEHHFRRIEDTLEKLFSTKPPTAFAVRPPEGRKPESVMNDLSIGITSYLQRRFASIKVKLEDAAAFKSNYVFRIDKERNLVYVAPRIRSRDCSGHVTPFDAEHVVHTGDAGDAQLAQRINVSSPEGRKLVLAAATLFNSNYLTSPVSFLGHVDHELDIALRSVYPEITVLNDTHPTYGKIVIIL